MAAASIVARYSTQSPKQSASVSTVSVLGTLASYVGNVTSYHFFGLNRVEIEVSPVGCIGKEAGESGWTGWESCVTADSGLSGVTVQQNCAPSC